MVEYINSRACMQLMHLKILCFVKLLRTRSALLSMRCCQINQPKLVKSAHEYLQAPRIPSRHHQLRRLVWLLLQLQSESPRHQGSASRKRYHLLPRGYPTLVYQLQCSLRSKIKAKVSWLRLNAFSGACCDHMVKSQGKS